MILPWSAWLLGAFAQGASTPTSLAYAPLEITLPDSAEPAEPADTDVYVPVDGPWVVVRTLDGVRTWETRLPTRTRTLFFHRPPTGMVLVRRKNSGIAWANAKKVHHKPMDSQNVGTWSFDSHTLQVRRPIAAGPPRTGSLAMRFAEATNREQDLREPSDGAHKFVVRSIQIDDTTRHGFYLTPGTEVRATVEVPSGAELRFAALSVPPQAAPPDIARDGQSILVQIEGPDGRIASQWSARPADASPVEASLPLTAVAGETVDVVFRAEPDGTDRHDAVFVASPTVLTPDPSPPRVVVVFIDTLRQDALSLYGNPLPTSPGIDAWAREATVFTHARSVAPWTLPTARSLFTGRAPEQWRRFDDLPTQLGAEGWATAFIAGNIYLSSNFDMAGGWSVHRCINWPQADVQVERAQRWLDAQGDRPAFLVLHFMDMHLPYTEPVSFRDRFAGPTPEPFTHDVFHRNQVVQWSRDMDDDSRAWLRGRYHNNLAYIDSVLTPFLEGLPSDATVVLLSDHGEEFWDHGDFEHGHTLYDELLRVPLVVRGPGFGAGEISAPTSLLDVAPTVLRAAGLTAEVDGVALQDIARAPAHFEDRAVGFGRPLYGQRRWGVVRGNLKYTTWKSTETLVDLATDPDEAVNLLPDSGSTAEWHQVLSDALRTPVHIAWSLYPQRSSKSGDMEVEITVPEGILAAWAAEDPTLMSTVETSVGPQAARLVWEGGKRGTREAYVVPTGSPLAALPDASIRVTVGDVSKPLPVPSEPPVMDGRNHVLGRVRVGGRSVSLQATVVPLPPDESVGIEGFNEEVQAELEALGYIEDE